MTFMMRTHLTDIAPTFRPSLASSAFLDASFGRRGWLAVGLLLALIALPSLLLPLGHDQSFFYVCGRRILNGELPYRDFVDIKPPAVYYLYAVAALVGDPVGVRALDLLIQGASCLLMIALVRRCGAPDGTAALAAVIYASTYYGTGYGDGAQCESVACLVGMGIAWMILVRRSAAAWCIAGLLCGVLFLFKFTMGALLLSAATMALLPWHAPWARRNGRLALLTVGCAIAVAGLALYMGVGELWDDFGLITRFTGPYAAIEWSPPTRGLKNMLVRIPEHLAQDLTLLWLAGLMAGIAALMRGKTLLDIVHPASRRLLLFATLGFLTMLATVAVEAKYAGYHFIRIHGFAAVVAAFGIAAAARRHAARRVRHGYARFMIPPLAAAMLLFGPIPRWAWHTLVPAVTAADPAPDRLHEFGAALRVRYGLRGNGTPATDGEMFVLSSQGSMISLYAGITTRSKITGTSYVTAPFAPPIWRADLAAYLLRVRPRVIVADIADSLPGISGSDATSLIALTTMPGVDTMLANSYRRDALPKAMAVHHCAAFVRTR